MCAHRDVSNERNRRAAAAIWSGFRFNPRFVRLPNASADAVLCQLSSTVDPFGFLFRFLFEVFRMRMNRDPYRIRWAVYGWMVPITSVVMCRGLENAPTIHLVRCSFKKEKRNKCVAVWPEKEKRELDRCLLFHPNCCARWPRKKKWPSVLYSTGRSTQIGRRMDWKKLFCRANWPKTHGC